LKKISEKLKKKLSRGKKINDLNNSESCQKIISIPLNYGMECPNFSRLCNQKYSSTKASLSLRKIRGFKLFLLEAY